MKNRNTIFSIIFRNTFTLFNFVNLILAIMIISVGSYKNLLFVFVAIINTILGIINEVKAKIIVDRLRLISEKRPTVIRHNQTYQVPPEEIKRGDLISLSLGDQILFDCEVVSGEIEVSEAFITGEQDNILKRQKSDLISGSFVVSGSAIAKVRNSEADSFIAKLEKETHTIKPTPSKLFLLINNIVKYISYILIPVGILVLWARFRIPNTDPENAVTSTVAALINMIPGGLVLLTTSVLALAASRLGKKRILVQDFYAIETLARVDTLCLDKTGTLTTGNMKVHDYIDLSGRNALVGAVELILSHVESNNATDRALRKKFHRGLKNVLLTDPYEIIPFSSDRKYSGIKGKDTYLMGAIEFMTSNPDFLEAERKMAGNYRIISVLKRTADREELLGFIRLEDEIRKNASSVVDFFRKNNVALKIISGDNLSTVLPVAKNAGLKELNGIDLSTLKNPDYDMLVKTYDIFARVRPSEKKALILALKNQGHTVAMTGDGVNDILAMKEADCSISLGDGTDATRRISKIVLLNSDFTAVPDIIAEGRQSINNLERSTSLFLAKTVYAIILAILFVFLPLEYPFSPIEMSLLNFTCIGLPGLILALEKNTDRIKNKFATNIIEYSIPIGLTVSVCMLALSIAANFHEFSRSDMTTLSVFITFAINLTLIYQISRPLNRLRGSLMVSIIVIMFAVFAIPFLRDFFEFTSLGNHAIIVAAIIISCSFLLFYCMHSIARKVSAKFINHQKP